MTQTTRERPHVLVVAYDFPPHAAIGTMRTLRVVQQLHARGWNITVLTGHPRSFLPKTPVDASLLGRVPSDVRIVRADAIRGWSAIQRTLRGVMGRRPSSGARGANVAGASHPRAAGPMFRLKNVVDAALSIPDRHIGWLLPALARGAIDQIRLTRPDIIYSSSPPWTGQLVASGLKSLINRPWVADFRDPWARAPWRDDREPFATRIAARLERHVVRRADHIIFVARGNHDDFAAHYGPELAAKFHVVSNGCDPSDFEGIEPSSSRSSDLFVLLHAGSLYAGRTPISLLNALSAAVRRGLIDPLKFRLRFLGSVGLQGASLPAVCQELGLQDVVEFLPRVPRRESLAAMLGASALLLLQPGHGVSVPAKLYEYMAAGRPILAIAEEGEIAELVRATGLGVSVAPGNDDSLVAALISLMRIARSDLRPPSRQLFDGTVRALQTVTILEAIASGQTLPARPFEINVQSNNTGI